MQATIPLPVAAALPSPGSAASLDAYLQAVSRFPMLSAEEERALARRFRTHDDLEAARRLVLSHLRLVVSVARGYLGYGLPYGDLIQEGNVGLMKAVKRFDPERGVRLVSFAIHWIRAEIHEFILRNWRLVKLATTKAQRKLFFNLRSLRQGLAPISREEARRIARELKVKPQDVLEMETRLAGGELAFEPEAGEEQAYAPAHYLAANPEDEPSRRLEAAQTEQLRHEALRRALAALDPRSRRIIEARWLRDRDAATLHDLAREFRVSAERIRQLEAKALEKMKKVMLAQPALAALPAPAL
jgi:RNA polymerase sigma-32 factor